MKASVLKGARGESFFGQECGRRRGRFVGEIGGLFWSWGKGYFLGGGGDGMREGEVLFLSENEFFFRKL